MKIRYAGLAPNPDQLERMTKETSDESPERGDVHDNEIRTETFPNGVSGGITPTLSTEITQIIWSTHWEHQKRILDHVEAVIASDRQWTIVRRILMGITTEQVDKMRLLVGQRIRQEMFNSQQEEENDK